jgi:hypothetical protein
MRQILRIAGGFVALIVGAIFTLPLPELGVPLLLLGTRLLGDRYKWARTLNAKIDAGWAKAKARLNKFFGR